MTLFLQKARRFRDLLKGFGGRVRRVSAGVGQSLSMGITLAILSGCAAPKVDPAGAVTASVYARRPPSASVQVVQPPVAAPGALVADLVAVAPMELEGAVKQAMHAKAMELGGTVLVFLPVEAPIAGGPTVNIQQEVVMPRSTGSAFAAGMAAGARSSAFGASYGAEMRDRRDRDRRVFRAQVFAP